MSIQKEELLKLAEDLSTGCSETHWRSSVSRAYYAAYHGCTVWHSGLAAPGSIHGTAGGAHQQLLNRLSNPAPEVKGDLNKTSKVLGIKLNTMRIHRHKADYALDDTVDAIAAANACALASDILLKIELVKACISA